MIRYTIDADRSVIHARADSSVHPIEVETTGLEGWFEADLGHRPDLAVPPKGSLEIETERLKTGNGLYDRELERRLEMRKYRKIRGEIHEVREVEAGSRYRVRGSLSFHGVTKEVEGEVRLRFPDDSTVEIEGEQVFDMRDFGLEPPKLMMLKVHPEIHVRGRVLARREG